MEIHSDALGPSQGHPEVVNQLRLRSDLRQQVEMGFPEPVLQTGMLSEGGLLSDDDLIHLAAPVGSGQSEVPSRSPARNSYILVTFSVLIASALTFLSV